MTVVFDVFALSLVAYLFLLGGLALVILEMFTPGFGVPGITGIVLLIIGVGIAARNNPAQAAVLVVLLLLILGVAFVVSLYALSKGSLMKTPLANLTSLTAEEGFHSLEEVSFAVGSVGVVVNALRPVGVVEIDGTRVEASSESAFIDKGAQVCVVSVEGRRIIVAPYVAALEG